MKNMLIGCIYTVHFMNFGFLEYFQKPPSGWWIPARRLINTMLILGSRDRTAWRY